jgi:hypothetical protein
MGYEISWEPPNGVIKRHFGEVIGSEVLAAITKIEGDERFDTLRYVINDFLDCTGLTVSPVEIVEIAAIDNAAAATNPNIRVATSSRQAAICGNFRISAARHFVPVDCRSWSTAVCFGEHSVCRTFPTRSVVGRKFHRGSNA